MKKSIIISMAAALALTATAALAQSAQQGQITAPRSAAQGITQHMTEQLSLTAEQQAQVKALNEKYADLFKRPPFRHGHGPKRGPQGGCCCGGQQPPQAPDSACCPPPDVPDGPCSEADGQQAQKTAKDKAAKKDKANKGGKGSQLAEQREAYDKELRSILTDEQYSTWKKSQPQRRHHGGPRRPIQDDATQSQEQAR